MPGSYQPSSPPSRGGSGPTSATHVRPSTQLALSGRARALLGLDGEAEERTDPFERSQNAQRALLEVFEHTQRQQQDRDPMARLREVFRQRVQLTDVFEQNDLGDDEDGGTRGRVRSTFSKQNPGDVFRSEGDSVFESAQQRVGQVFDRVENGETLLDEEAEDASSTEQDGKPRSDEPAVHLPRSSADVGVITNIDVNVFKLILSQMTGQSVQLGGAGQMEQVLGAADGATPDAEPEQALGLESKPYADGLSPEQQSMLADVRQSRAYVEALTQLKRSGSVQTKEGSQVAYSTSVQTRDGGQDDDDDERTLLPDSLASADAAHPTPASSAVTLRPPTVQVDDDGDGVLERQREHLGVPHRVPSGELS